MSLELNAISPARPRLIELGRKSIAAHSVFLIPLAVYCMGYEILHMLRPETGPAHLFVGVALIFFGFIPAMLLGLGLMRFYHMARYVKPKSPTRGLINEYKQFLGNPARIVQGLPALLTVSIMAFIFSDVQSNILTLQPDTWDQLFADWDKAIHFGKQPWEWLQPVIGYAPITFLINLNYNMWFFTMMMLLIFFGFAEKTSITRTRFFITFIGIWIVSGNILAVVFSSAGPCYFSRLGLSPDPYAGLMHYLRGVNETIPVWAVSLQDLLWQGHMQNLEGSVVSAMPSLHNGSALLFAIAGFHINKFWGRVLALHAALIYIGSIHLAWHYAIDSYLSWAVTVLIWSLSAPLASWWHSTKTQKTFETALEA
jgi:hypothetical protein